MEHKAKQTKLYVRIYNELSAESIGKLKRRSGYSNFRPAKDPLELISLCINMRRMR